jgi:hypothetical protein
MTTIYDRPPETASVPADVERLATQGWRVYPASTHSKAACIADPGARATADLDQLERWARDFPGCNWRAIPEGSGWWALDVDIAGPDHAADGVAALAALVAQHGPLPPRPMIRTGGGGVALFFRHRGEPIHGRTGWPAPGLDPRRGRLSVTVPPSRHRRSGQLYRWIVPPWDIPLPDAPSWLLRAVAPPPESIWTTTGTDTAAMPECRRRRYTEAALRRAVQQVATAQEGTRNDTLNRACFGLTRFIATGDLTPAEIADALAVAAQQASMPMHEVRATLASALRAGRAAS